MWAKTKVFLSAGLFGTFHAPTHAICIFRIVSLFLNKWISEPRQGDSAETCGLENLLVWNVCMFM